MASITETTAEWLLMAKPAAVPADVRQLTRLRTLDVIGLVLAASATAFGERVRRGVLSLEGKGPSRSLPFGDELSPEHAALLNGTLSQALQFDDTHNETIIHVSSPNVATALALGEATEASGTDILTAIALGVETTCRFGLIAPGRFHGNGFHPSGIFGTFGATAVAARMLGLDRPQTVAALGLAGSFASGLVECWTDGTDSQWVHPGWSSQAGITAAKLARAGVTGPARILEGRFGLFASHVQDKTVPLDPARATSGLGAGSAHVWESRKASFKPYPCAHVIHPFLDALLALMREHGFDGDGIASIDCPIARYMVPVVCEPRAEKSAPPNDVRARVSLAWNMAEAAYTGRLAADAFSDKTLADPRIQDLTRRVSYSIDATAPGSERYKGWVVVNMKDGRRLEKVQDHNWGSAANPMTAADIEAKFTDNARRALPLDRIPRIIEAIGSMDGPEPIGRRLIDVCCAPVRGR